MDTKVFNVNIEVYGDCSLESIEAAVGNGLEDIRCECSYNVSEGLERQLHFISLNCDGEQREWHMSPSAMYNEYHSEECNLPMLDDPIVSCTFGGTMLYFETFSDMVYTFFGEQ